MFVVWYRLYLTVLRKRLNGDLFPAPHRCDAEDLSMYLNANGLESKYYHAGLSDKAKSEVIAGWMKNKPSHSV